MTDVANSQASFALYPDQKSNTETVINQQRMPLLHAPVNIGLRVIHCGTSKGMVHRLSSMGITENSIITVTHQTGSNLVIAIGNSRLAIAPSIASKIIVTPVAG